jgi:glycosyltransferase involved in cell wall biosynthesis
MKILYILNYFPPRHTGGAEISAVNSCYGLLQRGHECSVLSINSRFGEDVDRSYTFKGIPVLEVGYRRQPRLQACQVFDLRIYRRIVRELERTKPDLVHVHNVSGTSLAPFVACRKLGIPTVVTLHDFWLLCANNMLYRGHGILCDPAEPAKHCRECFRRYDFWGDIPGRRWVFAQIVQNVRCFIAPSGRLRDLHVRAGYDLARFRVLKCGVEPNLFEMPMIETRLELDVNDFNSNRLVFAGAIAENKGIGTVIEALPLFIKYIDDFRLLVAGDGEEAFLAQLRRYTPISVNLLGKVPFGEMMNLYATAGLTLMPSIIEENSPLVVYESLLAGTPVLGAAIGGIPELVEEGRTGYLFRPGDPVDLAEKAILHFARSAPERRAMRKHCRAYALANLTLERHVDGLLEIYREAIE